MECARMPQPMPSEFADVIADVRARFQTRLIDMINEIEFSKQDLGQPQKMRGAMSSIGGVVHKISGIAGSVGFDHLGQQAAALDAAFARCLSAVPATPPSATMLAALEDLLDHMEECLDA